MAKQVAKKQKLAAGVHAWRLNKNTMWRWRFVDERGNIIAESHHGYTRQETARKGAERAAARMAKHYGLVSKPQVDAKAPADFEPPVEHGNYHVGVDLGRKEAPATVTQEPRRGLFAKLRRRG